jgi:hypothetical protein
MFMVQKIGRQREKGKGIRKMGARAIGIAVNRRENSI